MLCVRKPSAMCTWFITLPLRRQTEETAINRSNKPLKPAKPVRKSAMPAQKRPATQSSGIGGKQEGAAKQPRVLPPELIHATVATVQAFVEETTKIQPFKGVLWFRGVSHESHELVPSLYRQRGATPADELRRIEEQLNRRFRDRSMPYGFQGRDESSDVTDLQSWWRLFTMQHYGTPTRLLDWSENALIALCFAVFSAPPKPTEDAIVWVLDPCRWNNIGNANHIRAVSVDEHGAGPYAPLPSSNQHVAANWPLAIFGMHNSPRVVTQQGTFVVFPPGNAVAMENHASTSSNGTKPLLAIKLQKEALSEIGNSLRRLGFTHSSLYPDLHGLSTDLKKEFGY